MSSLLLFPAESSPIPATAMMVSTVKSSTPFPVGPTASLSLQPPLFALPICQISPPTLMNTLLAPTFPPPVGPAVPDIRAPLARTKKTDGRVHLSHIRNQTVLTQCYATSPLKLLSPRPAAQARGSILPPLAADWWRATTSSSTSPSTLTPKPSSPRNPPPKFTAATTTSLAASILLRRWPRIHSSSMRPIR